MFDGEQATGTQPAPSKPDDRGYHRHPVGTAEQRVMRVMLRYFRFQNSSIRDVGRVGNHQVDLSVEFGEQAGRGDVGTHQLYRGTRRIAAGIVKGAVGVVNADDAGL